MQTLYVYMESHGNLASAHFFPQTVQTVKVTSRKQFNQGCCSIFSGLM